MELKEFLKRVLPSEGDDYFGATANTSGVLKQSRLASIDALEKYITANHRNDVYFATGTYTGKRTQEKAQQKKALYLDLDVGPEDGKYADKKTAAAALIAFSRDHFLPPSIIVDSGGGLHAYWTLDKPIHSARWLPLSSALKELCAEHALRADRVVTADAARILRAPGSINYKHNPRPVSVIHEGADYTLSELQQHLSAPTPALSLAYALGTDADDLSSGVGFSPRRHLAEYMTKQCPMYADAVTTGGKGLSEVLWNHQLHVLAFCEDGENYIHEISKGYTGYAETETRMKWNQRLSRVDSIGPTLCTTFSQHSDKCAKCPHFGTISTPLQLGVKRDWDIPLPYQQDDVGIFYVDESSDHRERMPVVNFRIEHMTYAHEIGTPAILQFQAITKKKKSQVTINIGPDIHDSLRCITIMSEAGIPLDRFELTRFKDLMVAWAKHIQKYKNPQRATSQLGWVSNPIGFALATEVVYTDERVINNIYGNKHLANLFCAEGVREPWIKAAHTLTQQKRHAIDAAILTAFAAPLLKFVSDPSAIIAFVSSKSGSGKTTALQVAQAVWGNPREAMNQLDDTTNAIFKKMGYLNSLPAYWDEVRAKGDVDKFLAMIFQLTGGKERSRLTQQTDLREVQTWNTILSVASNESIADHATHASPDSEAGRARVFEVDVPAIEQENNIPAVIGSLMLEVYENYGVIGSEYADFLVQKHGKIKKLVAGVQKSLRAELMTDTAERFWLSSVTVLIAAAAIANKLQYTDVDIPSFTVWIKEQFKLQQDDQRSEYVSEADRSQSLLMDFLSEHRSNVIVYEYLTRQGLGKGAPNGKVFSHPITHGEVVAGVATLDKKARVNKRAFRDWLYEKKLGTPRMALQELTYTETRAFIDAVDDKGFAARVRCYDIDLPGGVADDLVSDTQ